MNNLKTDCCNDRYRKCTDKKSGNVEFLCATCNRDCTREFIKKWRTETVLRPIGSSNQQIQHALSQWQSGMAAVASLANVQKLNQQKQQQYMHHLRALEEEYQDKLNDMRSRGEWPTVADRVIGIAVKDARAGDAVIVQDTRTTTPSGYNYSAPVHKLKAGCTIAAGEGVIPNPKGDGTVISVDYAERAEFKANTDMRDIFMNINNRTKKKK